MVVKILKKFLKKLSSFLFMLAEVFFIVSFECDFFIYRLRVSFVTLLALAVCSFWFSCSCPNCVTRYVRKLMFYDILYIAFHKIVFLFLSCQC